MKMRICILWFVPFSTIVLSGCGSLTARGMLISAYPKFSQTLQQMQPVPPDQSRIIIYFPKAPFAGGVGVGAMGGVAQPVFKLTNEQYETQCTLMDQTAVYYDVPPGTYKFADGTSGKPLDITVEPSKTYYIKIGMKESVLAKRNQAIEEIEKMDILGHPQVPSFSVIPKQECRLLESAATPNQSEQAGLTKLYVIRSHGIVGSYDALKIGLDSQPKFVLKNKQYYCIWAPPGKHLLSYSDSYSINKLAFEIDLKKDMDNYVLLFTEGNRLYYPLKVLTAGEAEKYLKKCKLCKNGYLSSKL